MKHFRLDEFFFSETAERLGINNTPAADKVSEVVCNIKALVDNVLDPLRRMVGRPIIITSGYRCQSINDVIGGSHNSQHMKGMAADIHVQGYTPEQMQYFYEHIKAWYAYDQLIYYPKKNIIHVSYAEGRNRMEAWVA